MSELVRMSVSGRVAVVTVDNPPVNALSPGVPEGIADRIREAGQNPDVDAIVLIGAGSTFVAGADIKEFAKIAAGLKPPLKLADILLEIEDCPKPIVVAIHGTAFGGGLELAMACHYRVMAASAKVGQPEVNLGIIPGAAGTQRLPRLAGMEKALEMCSLGQPIGAQEALACGIADRVIERDLLEGDLLKGALLEGALAFAEDISSKPIPKTRDRGDKLSGVLSESLVDAVRERAQKQLRGRSAPLAAIEAVAAATRVPFEEGCRIERDLFEKCLKSAESRALIHAFFGEREVAKIPGLAKSAVATPVASAAVIGAGTMGSGIAMVYANAGIPVILKETDADALDRGMATIRKNWASSVAKGKLSGQEMESRVALISPRTTYDGFEAVDVITEAVFEQMDVKKRIFSEIDQIARPGCILASNTSALDLDAIASATARPESVVGHHFFSPANVMRLLEVVRGKATADSVLASSMALAKRLKKVAVVARNARGFIGNRLLHPYLREAQFLVEEGASVEEVNSALYDFGMPMGPLAMCDLIGLDIEYRIHQGELEHLKPGVRVPLAVPLLFQAGRLGQKNGLGFSRYSNGRQAIPDPEISDLIHAASMAAGIERRVIPREEIVDRCVLALANEGARVLEEGTAQRPLDIDVVYMNGYGFPSWRGGPMFYADEMGLKPVLARIEEFQARHGDDLWAPASLLAHLVGNGETFASLNKKEGD